MTDYLQTGINSVKELITFLTDRSKSKDILRNDLLREMRDNLKLLDHRNKEGVQLNVLIAGLNNSAINKAYAFNYSFNALVGQHKKLPPKYLLNKRQEKYVGWNAERFIYSIEGKIKDLQNLPALYPDLISAPVNIPVRLDNLFYQILLLVIFIRNSD